jgi:hypothetical protein
MNLLKGFLDLGLIMIPDPVPEKLAGNLDLKGLFIK